MTSPVSIQAPGGASAPKTLADWLAQPEDAYLELIDGEFVEKAAPFFEHGVAQGSLMACLRGFARKLGGPDGPGGWWIASEVDIALDSNGYRPDVAGWRRERVPVPPKTRPVTVRPDWICEVVSESNRRHDTIKKLRRYQQAGVPHYWILDPLERSLTVYRNGPEGYLVLLAAEATETVRAEPFEAVALKVGELLGDDPE
jgi:Uma2 family endonuclease